MTDKGKLLLNFFCQIVDVVIAINATTVATNPIVGISVPISNQRDPVQGEPVPPRLVDSCVRFYLCRTEHAP